MTLKVGIDFGTSNSGVAIYDGQRVSVLPIDRQNVQPEVVKTVLYITRDHQATIGQEAIAHYYRHNVNRQRRFVRQWAGEIDVYGGDMYFVRDVYVMVDELKPGRLMQYLKTALRKEAFRGTQVFERYYTAGELVQTYLGLLAFVEAFIFIVILLAGLAYLWKEGDLEWVRTMQEPGARKAGE